MNQESNNTSNNQEKSSASSINPNPCPICLGPIIQESYLDQCFHQFCYNCILQWTKVVASKHSSVTSSIKCPLCKIENSSIIYGYNGSSFQQHYVNGNLGSSDFFSKAHKYRLQCYYTEAESLAGTLIDTFSVTRYWKLRKYLQTNQWLHSWLRREIQALTQEEDVDIIVHHIQGVIESFGRNDEKHSRIASEIKQKEFKVLVSEAARPFLTGRTDRFVSELEMFLASGMNIDAFDKVYIRHLGWRVHEITKDEDEDAEPFESAPLVPHLYFFFDDSEEDD